MARRRRKSQDEETTYWLSYSDMMAAVLLVFILIITFTMLQAKKQYEDNVRAAIEADQQIQEQKAEIEIKNQKIEEQQARLDVKETKIRDFVGMKDKLITALEAEFSDYGVTVSETGAIQFDSNILFDFDKSELKWAGKESLEDFLPRYLKVLSQDEFKDHIAEIIVEGHTDTKGDYLYNLKLSQDRALSVATFCFGEENRSLTKKQRDYLRDMLTANGRSYSKPITNDDGTVNMRESRRVEFKFRLKEDEMLDELNRAFIEEADEE